MTVEQETGGMGVEWWGEAGSHRRRTTVFGTVEPRNLRFNVNDPPRPESLHVIREFSTHRPLLSVPFDPSFRGAPTPGPGVEIKRGF